MAGIYFQFENFHFQKLPFQFLALEVENWNGMEVFFTGSFLKWNGSFFYWKLKTGMEWKFFLLEVKNWNGMEVFFTGS